MRKARAADAAGGVALLRDEVSLGTPAPAGAGGIRAAACYPHTYRVGMASLGYQLVWGMLAAHPAFSVERFFAAAPGRPPAGVVREPRSLETGTPLAAFDVVAVSAYYEPDYFRVYGLLAGGGVRPWAAERGEFDPFVILGGPAVTANPEPLAPFADAVVLGDAEESLPAVLDVIAAAAGAGRRDVLRGLADIAGVYVPAFYRVRYGAAGTPPEVEPLDGVPAAVGPARVADLTPYRGGSWLATRRAEFGKLMLLEPLRGCGRRCSFCETGVINSPPRGRDAASLHTLLDDAEGRVKKVGLVGAAVADYDGVEAFAAAAAARGFAVSTSSLALGARATPALLKVIGESGQRSVALAPEAATAEMRGRLGKPLAAGRLKECLGAAADAGITRVKLYYITGVPGESREDVAAIGAEVARLKKEFPGLRLEARVNPLVPKRGTPLAAAPLMDKKAFAAALRTIKGRAGGVPVTGGSWREAEVQTKIGRGDRSLARWLARRAEGGQGG